MNKQPFYHYLEICFTATKDQSAKVNSDKFLKKLAKFLETELGAFDTSAVGSAEAGDPADLL